MPLARSVAASALAFSAAAFIAVTQLGSATLVPLGLTDYDGIARLGATNTATQILGVASNRGAVIWNRAGTTGEIGSVIFEQSADRVTWTRLGEGRRVANSGWTALKARWRNVTSGAYRHDVLTIARLVGDRSWVTEALTRLRPLDRLRLALSVRQLRRSGRDQLALALFVLLMPGGERASGAGR